MFLASAGLVWDTPDKFMLKGPYDSENATFTEQSWNNLNYDLGSIALSYDYAASLGLSKAQPFPWDDSKRLYFLNAYHSVHCLVSSPSTLPHFFS
jgi:hypothetical protein